MTIHTPRIRYILMLIFAAIIYFSCNPTKQATKHLGKALTEDRNFVLDTLRKLSPCVTTARDTVVNTIVKSHTDTAYQTQVISIACPDSAGVKIIRQVEYKIRTITNTDSFYVNREITVTKRDMSDSIHYIREKEALVKANIKLQKKVDFWMPTGIVCGILLLLLIAGIIISKQNNKIRSLLKAVQNDNYRRPTN